MKRILLLLILVFVSGCQKYHKIASPNLANKEPYFLKQRFGANFFNDYETLERMMAAKRLGIEFIRLTPSKWQSRRPGAKVGEFLIGDQNNYQGLYKNDLDQLIQVLDMANQVGLKVVLTFLNIPGRMWKQHHNNIVDCRLWKDNSFHDQAVQFFTDLTIAVGKHQAFVGRSMNRSPSIAIQQNWIGPMIHHTMSGIKTLLIHQAISIFFTRKSTEIYANLVVQ